MNGLYKWVEQIAWVGQLGFSLLFPLVCLLGLCWLLTTRFGVGGWVYVPGILLGLAVGASTFLQFARKWMKRAERDAKRRSSGFNQH